MLKAFTLHKRPSIFWRAQKTEARLLEPVAVVLLGQRQYGCYRADINVLAQFLLAHQLEPLHAVPISRNEQMLGHDIFPIFFRHVRKRVGVHEKTEKRPEHLSLHVKYARNAVLDG